MGDILGGGGGGQSAQSYDIRGVVESVDVNGRSVYLTNVSGGYNSMLSNSGSAVRVYYDPNTPVDYQGRAYRPEDLERGDEVSVRVDESGNRLVAQRMTVLRDVGTGGGYPSSGSGSYASTVRGTVRHVDTSRRTLEIDRGTGSTMILEWDTNTPVRYSNQNYQVGDLERGDEVDVRVRDLGRGRMLAEDIVVVRNVSSGGTFGGGNTSTQVSTVRGTVLYVDTSRRTIELESTSWYSSRFQSGTGSNSGRLVLSYDTNTQVDVQGRLHPVSGLERGDIIDVQVRSLGGSSYLAERVILVRNVRQ